MAEEQTFRSPGFFEREIDLSQRQKEPLGVPAGIIGTSQRGPAFIPVTVGSYTDFQTRFGGLDPNMFGPYAVKEYLKQKEAATFLRVLGAGSNDTAAEISNTKLYGTVSKAGFWVKSVYPSNHASGLTGSQTGKVQFLVADHYVSASESDVGFPVFVDNDSFPNLAIATDEGKSTTRIKLLRGVLFSTTGSRVMLADWNANIKKSAFGPGGALVDHGAVGNFASINDNRKLSSFSTFKVIISSSDGGAFSSDDDVPGLRIFSASLNPASPNYLGDVLNTDPWKFQEKQHLLYLDFAVSDEVATVATQLHSVGIVSGSRNTNGVGLGDSWLDSFGRFDTRYTTPKTPAVISQPFGRQEHDLFHFETLSDGQNANHSFKVSITNLRASIDVNNPYGTFDVEIRDFRDTDESKTVLEAYPQCNLDPNSDRYIGRVVGDYKAVYNFDAEDPDERRVVVTGKYPNLSSRIRVVVSNAVENKHTPKEALPFGFRGIPVIKTNDSLTDNHLALTSSAGQYFGYTTGSNPRIASEIVTGSDFPGIQNGAYSNLTGSIIPPLPYRFKVTKGMMSANPVQAGWPGTKEFVDSRLYWGTMDRRVPISSSFDYDRGIANAVLQPNEGTSGPNRIVRAYSKFQGISKTDTLVTGSAADVFNNNKFTLARVCLLQTLTNLSEITGSAREHMLDAAYIRNGAVDPVDYRVRDGSIRRLTFASLVNSSSIKFNRFQSYMKFTFPFYGGFDGLNILDQDCHLMNDKASSTDARGLAGTSIAGGLGLYGTNDASMMGSNRQNNVVFAYRKAAEIMTDPMTVRGNLLVIPGIRDPFITDYAMRRTQDYSKAMYIMDIQHYDDNMRRLYLTDPERPDPRETAEQFESRRVDNNYAATYFPDVYIEDDENQRVKVVPSSIAALGALAYNDKVSFPWFAPAGFNRAALGFVTNTEVRLSSGDRDILYDARVNPIANFPRGGFVIFGQKTLQIAKSALDRVNVRRMLLEVKRLVVQVAQKLLFEPNNANTRSRFTSQVGPILALIQTQQGIEKWSIVMDDSNNSEQDREQNKLNGRIVLVPTRAVEFIAIDFIITNSGVEFV